MDHARIERKRAYDRQAQRVNRAKNRAYITQLETTIADLTQGDHEDRLAYLSSCAKEKDGKIEALQKALMKIKAVVQEVSGATGDESSALTCGVGRGQLELQPSETERGDGDTSAEIALDAANAHAALLPADLDALHMARAENYFKKLNQALTHLENTVDPGCLSAQADDEDIAIRAVVAGWDRTADVHRLDPVWGVLRELDEEVYWRSGLVERAAILRLTRAMLLHKIHPPHQLRRAIPPFMRPTVLQRAHAHPPLVDLFAWPGFRDWLIQNGVRSISTASAVSFALNFRFVWPYEVADVYLTYKSSGRYTFSDAFTYCFNRLDSYRVTPWDDVADHLTQLGVFQELHDSGVPDTVTVVDGTECITSRPSDVVEPTDDDNDWNQLFDADVGTLSP